MKRVAFLGAILLAPLLLAAVGVCSDVQAPPEFHLDGQTCCAVSHCSLLAIGLLGVGLGADVTTVPSARAVLARSAAQQPVSPPPELLALRSA